jgi:hypothetical protein
MDIQELSHAGLFLRRLHARISRRTPMSMHIRSLHAAGTPGFTYGTSHADHALLLDEFASRDQISPSELMSEKMSLQLARVGRHCLDLSYLQSKKGSIAPRRILTSAHSPVNSGPIPGMCGLESLHIPVRADGQPDHFFFFPPLAEALPACCAFFCCA